MFGDRLTDYFAAVIFIALGQEPPIYPREEAPLHMATFLDSPSKTGWETEGGCATFFGGSSKDVLEAGMKWKAQNQSFLVPPN